MNLKKKNFSMKLLKHIRPHQQNQNINMMKTLPHCILQIVSKNHLKTLCYFMMIQKIKKFPFVDSNFKSSKNNGIRYHSISPPLSAGGDNFQSQILKRRDQKKMSAQGDLKSSCYGYLLGGLLCFFSKKRIQNKIQL